MNGVWGPPRQLPNHTPDYFIIQKFSPISDDAWTDPFDFCERERGGSSREADSLRALFWGIGYRVMQVNDGLDPRVTDSTPKARILAVLRALQ